MPKQQTVPMQLPFAPMEWWVVTQGNNNLSGTHNGLNRFAYDFARAGASSDGAPVYAPARGKVIEIVDHQPPGGQDGNYIKVEHAAGEVCVPIHTKQGSIAASGIKVGDTVQMGQQIAAVGDTGTGKGNFHLHIALSNEPIPTGYETMQSQFMYYDVSIDNGKTFSFVRSGTPQEGEWVRRRSLWSPWASLGGKIVGAPAVVSPTSTTVDIYARGTDNKLWQKFWDGSNWNGWFPVIPGDTFSLASSPSVCSFGPNHRDVYVRGEDGAVYHLWWDGVAKKWNGWLPVGGKIVGDPAVVSLSPNMVDVYARGTDNKLWQTFWDGSKWSGWFPVIPGDTFALASSPAVYSSGPNHRDVYAQGQDGAAYQLWWDGVAKKWNGWFPLGGKVTAKPAALSRKPNQVDVFVRGADNLLWHRWWSGSPWSDWVAHEDGFTLGSALAVTSRAAEHVDLYVRGTDGSVWQKWWQA